MPAQTPTDWRIEYASTPVPTLRTMNFFRDQHKFSDWVYVAASANMAFWVLTGWALFSLRPTILSLCAMLGLAIAFTFSPVLLRDKYEHPPELRS